MNRDPLLSKLLGIDVTPRMWYYLATATSEVECKTFDFLTFNN